MNWKAAVKSLLISWDIWASAVPVLLVTVFLEQASLTYPLAKEVFALGVSVLSIVFSVFFAALAVLITAGDNAFVRFLETEGFYRQIIWTFKVTLLLLFIALALSTVLFVASLPHASIQPPQVYPKWLFMVFAFFAPYGLFSAIHSSLDAIKYAEYRAMYLKLTEDGKKTE